MFKTSVAYSPVSPTGITLQISGDVEKASVYEMRSVLVAEIRKAIAENEPLRKEIAEQATAYLKENLPAIVAEALLPKK
jgi:hypothetical protein